MVISLSPAEHKLFVEALIEHREKMLHQVDGAEQLLRRMVGDITQYMDVVGERPLHISDYDRASLAIRDGDLNAFKGLYHETVYPIFRSKKYVWGTYIWNFYDFSSEIRDEGGIKYRNGKGLITYDRQTRKDAFYYYKAQWSKEPFVYIAQRRFANRAKPAITVKVYSNQEKVTLSVNGNTYMLHSQSGIFAFENVPLQSGENVVKASSGSCTDEIVLNRVSEPDASYVFVDANPGLNVKNWFVDMIEEEKLFPKGRFSIRDSSDELLESDEAMAVLEEFSPKLAKQMRERGGSMKLERILYYMKNEFTDEQCKELNSKLITVKK